MKNFLPQAKLLYIILGIIFAIFALVIIGYFLLKPGNTMEVSRTNQLTKETNKLYTPDDSKLPSPFQENKAEQKETQALPTENKVPEVTATKEPLKENKVTTVKPTVTYKSKLAIIIDDLGYNLSIARQFINLPATLNYSVLPHTPFAKKIASLLQKKHKETLLHLPLEPLHMAKHNPGEGAILVNDSLQTMESKLIINLSFVPNAVGINNHMGSAFSLNEPAVNKLMQLLNKRALYFVDSRTIAHSLFSKTAKKHNVSFASRKLFLDATQSVPMAKQWGKIFTCVKQKSYCIIIAHPHSKTYDFLKKHLPELAQRHILLTRLHSVFQSK